MKPKRGEAPGGESFDPEALPEEPESPEEQPRPAPAPGLPISDEEYERLKESAKRGTGHRNKHAQEDLRTKKN